MTHAVLKKVLETLNADMKETDKCLDGLLSTVWGTLVLAGIFLLGRSGEGLMSFVALVLGACFILMSFYNCKVKLSNALKEEQNKPDQDDPA